MLLKNLTAKVIGVGTKILMPDGMDGDTTEVTKDIVELPAIKVFIDKGFLKVIPDKKPAKAKAEPKEETSEEEVVDTAEEKKPVKRAPRKPKSAE